MLVEKLINEKNKRGIAKLITLIENEDPAAELIFEKYKDKLGKSYIIGITGPPGAGKSSLTNQIAKNLLDRGNKVGVIAVDPSSPFTGGAILGDRIRMDELTKNENVFIRSMGSRGKLGGLSGYTKGAIKALEIGEYDYILVETVGVGQSEIDIIKNSYTTLMVMVPGLGDDIQAMKAGIMEIGDIFVVNKCDLPGADKTARELEMMLHMSGRNDIELLKTQAIKGDGIIELVDSVIKHREYLERTGKLEEKKRDWYKDEISLYLNQLLNNKLASNEKELSIGVDELLNNQKTTKEIVENIAKLIFKGE